MLKNPKVKGILVNIFGGIMKCDTIATGVITACKAVNLSVPLVVRMKGTNEELGKKMLAESGLPIIAADTMAEARPRSLPPSSKPGETPHVDLHQQRHQVITQGITGKTGQFHTEKCQEYANGKNCFVAGVNPKKAGESIFNIPIYASVKEAQQTGATVSVIYVPQQALRMPSGKPWKPTWTWPSASPKAFRSDMLMVRNKMKAKGSRWRQEDPAAGPQLPRPDHARRNQDRHHARSHPPQGPYRRGVPLGTLTYEAVAMLTEVGLGQSSAVGIGGDPINGLKHIDVMKAFQRRSRHRRRDHDRRNRRP